MTRLPQPGGDNGEWGDILNDFLLRSHDNDGSLKDGSVTESKLDSSAQAKLNVSGDWNTLANKPSIIAAGPDQAAARTAIGAGTSNLIIGTSSTTAKAGDYQPSAANISDATPTGQAVLTAANAAAARSALGITTNPTTTKRVTATFGSPNSGLANGAPTNIGTTTMTSRGLNMLQTTPTRYRFKIANVNATSGVNAGSNTTINSLWIGKPSYTDSSHNNKWLGDMTSQIQVYNGGALPSSGTTDLTTGWITNNGEITAYKPFVTSVGLATDGNLIMSDCYGGIQYGSTSNTQAGVGAPVSGWNYAGFVLDVRIEYEFEANKNDLIAFVIGASGESSYSNIGDRSSSARGLNDPVDTWPAVWAAREGYHVINAGLFGSSTNEWANTSSRPYSRFDLTTTVPDIAIIGSMPSNDLSLGTTLPSLISKYEALVLNLRSLGISRIFGTTIAPRGFNGSNETNRLSFNEYIRSIPVGLEGIFDADLALRDFSSPSQLLQQHSDSDGIHLTRSGYRHLAAQIKIGN